VGLEIPLTRLFGKWKVSQNRPGQDRDGVVEGLRQQGDPASTAMADAVRQARTEAPG
jgi:transcriptional regulator